MTDEQFERLPRHARFYIQKLRADLNHAVARAEVREGNRASTLVLAPYSDNPIFLPDAETVSFEFPTGAVHASRIHSQGFRGSRIRVASTSLRLHIEPEAANVIEVWPERL
jgi:hypothetical protein